MAYFLCHCLIAAGRNAPFPLRPNQIPLPSIAARGQLCIPLKLSWTDAPPLSPPSRPISGKRIAVHPG